MDELDYLPSLTLSQLPKRVGFRFVGVGLRGDSIPCFLDQDGFDGLVIRDERTKEICANELKAWRRYPLTPAQKIFRLLIIAALCLGVGAWLGRSIAVCLS